jgi:hypothetical protein
MPGVITKKQEERLEALYTGPDDLFEAYKNKLINLYQFIGTNNMHLSIPPIFAGVELFGSPVNTHNLTYCSPFEFERHFGSLGSFWDYKFHQDGVYLCNPPFDEAVIADMANKLMADLATTKHKVVVVITVPVWDSASQRKIGIKDYGLDFAGFTTMIESKFLRHHEILDKDTYKYWNYYTEERAPASWTHLVILSNLSKSGFSKNATFSVDDFLAEWADFSAAEYAAAN